MQNVLLDIGAHFGEALEETLRPIYKINRVYAIEPSSVGIKKLSRFKDKRLKIYPIAVSNYNGKANLFSAGSVGGGLFSDKQRHWKNTEIVNVFKFSEWALRSLNKNENIFIKINVEGSELFILQEIKKICKNFKIKSILLSIDIEKVPSLLRYKDDLHKLILDFPVQITIREDKETKLAVNKWLINAGLRSSNRKYLLSDLFRSYLPYDRNILRIIKPLFPKKVWLLVALKIGPNHAR
jgi:FkbM family methyltransferase